MIYKEDKSRWILRNMQLCMAHWFDGYLVQWWNLALDSVDEASYPVDEGHDPTCVHRIHIMTIHVLSDDDEWT